ncbi:MAG: undecaprenyl-diphosphate phosphatase [Candidatus Binataceae bacterium]
MFSRFEALILGAIQGLTEFLPVSSSAHLVIVPWLLKWRDPGLAFDVALHLGTLLALLVYYWREWVKMGMSLVNGDRKNRRLLAMLVVASIPGAIIGLAFEKEAETVFRSPLLIALAMAALGVALWLFDRITPQKRSINEISFVDAILIGLSQAFAIVPGVSRSGATITMARIVKLERQDAANFSFLMATPIIAGAGLVESRHLFRMGLLNPEVVTGFVAAAIFGLIAIAGLIRFVRTRTYEPFAWYRVIVAAFVIVVYFSRT